MYFPKGTGIKMPDEYHLQFSNLQTSSCNLSNRSRYSEPSHSCVAFPVWAYSSQPGMASVASLSALMRCLTCAKAKHL